MMKMNVLVAAICSCALLLSACGSDDGSTGTAAATTDAATATDGGATGTDVAGSGDAGSGDAGSGDAGSSASDTTTAGDAGPTVKMPPNAPPSADTKKLWTLMKDYATWTQFDETKTMPKSKSHQNMYVRAYYNKVVADFIKTGKPAPLPEGSIIVKANFKAKDAKKPAALTVMHKLKSGKWYWLKALANGNVFLGPDKKTAAEGTAVKSCIACHTNLAPKGNDLVAIHVFGKK